MLSEEEHNLLLTDANAQCRKTVETIVWASKTILGQTGLKQKFPYFVEKSLGNFNN